MSKTILVIDDDPSISSIFEFILQQAGYHTLSATSGREGLECLRSGKKMDLVFLDLKMPEMSGIETFQEIQKIDPKLLVVIMTGYSVDEMLKDAYKMGAYGVIYKPFDVEEVLAVIEKIFNLPSLS